MKGPGRDRRPTENKKPRRDAALLPRLNTGRQEPTDLSTPQHPGRPTVDVQRYRAIGVVDDQREPELLTSRRGAQSARHRRPPRGGLQQTELDAVQLSAATSDAELPSREVEPHRRARIRG